jgi:hypothetical protein
MFLNEGFKATGTVWLGGAKIGGQLNCRRGVITGEGVALNAQSAEITGSVFLDQGFKATGTVWLAGAKIGGQLSFRCAKITEPGGGRAVDLSSAQIGSLIWAQVGSCHGRLSLIDCHAGVLDDDAESWRLDTMTYELQGFTYQRLATPWRTRPGRAVGQAKRSAGVGWVASSVDPGLQPYRQLAGFYRSHGDHAQAREVMVAANREHATGWRRALSLIGYGYRPERALWIAVPWLVLLSVAVWSGNHQMLFIPTTEQPLTFQPAVYALEVMTPIIDLDQREYWIPDLAAEPWGPWLASLIWLSIGMGWALTTLVVAGFTNVVRRE